MEPEIVELALKISQIGKDEDCEEFETTCQFVSKLERDIQKWIYGQQAWDLHQENQEQQKFQVRVYSQKKVKSICHAQSKLSTS